MTGIKKTISPDGRGRGHYRVGGPADPNMSTEEIVIKANAGELIAGTVLGKVTATGQYAGYNPAAADGTEIAANAVILYADAPASAAVQPSVADFRHQVVNGKALTYAFATTAPQKAAVEAAMAARQLMVRY